jgi:ribosomal protein S27AE
MTLTHQKNKLVSHGDYFFMGSRGQEGCVMLCPQCGDSFVVKGTDPTLCAKCPLTVTKPVHAPCGHSFIIKDGEAVLL